MNKYFFLAILSVFNVKVLAIKPPTSEDEVKAIQDYIDQAKKIQSQIDIAARKLEEEKRKLVSDGQRIKALGQDLKKLKDRQKVAYNKAVHMTIITYEIVPVDTAGRPIMPEGEIIMHAPWQGKKASWIVVADKNEERIVQHPDGSTNAVGPFVENPFGVTVYDGVTIIHQNAFSSPAQLALTIYHEKIHFMQFITAGVGNKLTINQLEKAAWEAERRDADKFGLTEAEKVRHAEMVNEAIRYYQNEIKRETSDSAAPRTFTPPSPHGSRELETLKRESDRFDAMVNYELKVIRGEADILKELADLEKLKKAFVDIAKRSCNKPGSVSKDELAKLTYPPPNKSCPTMPSSDACESQLLSDMAYYVQSNFKLDAEWLEQTANAHRLTVQALSNYYSEKAAIEAHARQRDADIGNHGNQVTMACIDLARFVIAACKDPGQKTDDEVQMFVKKHAVVVRVSKEYSFVEQDISKCMAKNVQGCPRDLFMAMSRNKNITTKWVNMKAAEIARSYAPPSSYSNYSDSRSSSQSSENSSNTSQSSQSNSNTGSSNGGPKDNTPAKQQLKGIKSGARGFD